MSGVIDLCDSDQESPVNSKTTKSTLQDDDSSSSSSSSSDDEIWNTNVPFSQGSTTSTSRIGKRSVAGRGGAAGGTKSLTINEEYDEDDVGEGSSRQKANHYRKFGSKRATTSGAGASVSAANTSKKKSIPTKPNGADVDCIEIDLSSSDDERGNASVPAKNTATQRDSQLGDYFSHSNFDNKVARKSQVQFDSSDDENNNNDDSMVYNHDGLNGKGALRNKEIAAKKTKVLIPYENKKKSCYDSDSQSSSLGSNPAAKKAKVRNPYEKKKKCCYDSDSSSSSLESHPRGVAFSGNSRRKKKGAPIATSTDVPVSQTKEKVHNPYKKSSSNNTSTTGSNNSTQQKKAYESDIDDHSSSTASLFEEKKSNAKQHTFSPLTEENQIMSLDTDSDIGELAKTTHKIAEKMSRQSASDDSSIEKPPAKKANAMKSVDFSFELRGAFDSDDDNFSGGGESDSDDLMEPRVAVDSDHDEEDAKPAAKPSADQSFTLRDRVGTDFVEMESDDDDSSASSGIPLFTPRPFKKATKGSKSVSDAKAAANAAILTSEAGASNTAPDKKCPNTAASSSSASSKLLTPRLFSPPLNSPLGTFAVKRKVPTPAIPAMSKEMMNEIGGKLYPDLRHNFMVALVSHAKRLRMNAYERSGYDSALRSVVALSLHLQPIRSAEAARRIKGVGTNFYDLMKESSAGTKGKTPFAPKKNKYSTVAAAALVALLELEEGNKGVASAGGQSFPMEELITAINSRLDPAANSSLNSTTEKYLEADNMDPYWTQVKRLCTANAAADLDGPFVKERKRKTACKSGVVFELLDSGRLMAHKLRELAKAGPVEPGPLRQLPNETVDEEFGNVCMSMDCREGGGAGKSLHKMCDQLDIRGVPYVVRELKIADYIFFVGDKLAPILIERKTSEDVAGSLHDGRWERQQRTMRKAQFVLGDGPARRCQICYIIEGDANKRKVHGGNVGRRTYFQSVEDVENATEQLPLLGFSVMRSKGTLDTIGILAKIAQDVSWKANNGEFSCLVRWCRSSPLPLVSTHNFTHRDFYRKH